MEGTKCYSIYQKNKICAGEYYIPGAMTEIGAFLKTFRGDGLLNESVCPYKCQRETEGQQTQTNSSSDCTCYARYNTY